MRWHRKQNLLEIIVAAITDNVAGWDAGRGRVQVLIVMRVAIEMVRRQQDLRRVATLHLPLDQLRGETFVLLDAARVDVVVASAILVLAVRRPVGVGLVLAFQAVVGAVPWIVVTTRASDPRLHVEIVS